jgi:hypothetical protein
MSDLVIIKPSDSTNELQLSEQEGLLCAGGSEYYRVTLKVKGLEASAKVYAFERDMPTFLTLLPTLA